MKRQRTYHDLSADEKVRYDRLRALERQLNRYRESDRAKRCGSRADRRKKIKAVADAMLGLEPEIDTRVARERSDDKPWRGSATFYHRPSGPAEVD